MLNFLITIFLLICLYLAYQYYQKNNFNDFTRSELNLYTSQFERDNQVTYGKTRSYKIQSNTFNDAMFFQKVSIQKNTPYKVSCMVKTENIQAEEGKSGVGAQIAITDTTERSMAIQGTNEWQKIEFIFNSKNRSEIEVGFRLGGYLGNCTGTAWFSDFKIEEGSSSQEDQWNFACFVFENTDVRVNQKQVKLEVTTQDKEDIQDTIQRFELACQNLSNGKMKANCHIYQIQDPITNLSYDEEFGYYVAPEDVEEQIKKKINESEYDHIFIIVRLRR